MEKPDKPIRVNFPVRSGSALERFIRSSQSKTVSGALHDMAAAYEALGQLKSQISDRSSHG